MNIGIVGMGYVGATLAKAAFEVGHNVIGVEVNEARIKELSKIVIPISTDYDVLNDSEVIVIAVPTPLNLEKKPELKYLEQACSSINDVVNSSALVINESTSYPGTLRGFIRPRISRATSYASAPERVEIGRAHV